MIIPPQSGWDLKVILLAKIAAPCEICSVFLACWHKSWSGSKLASSALKCREFFTILHPDWVVLSWTWGKNKTKLIQVVLVQFILCMDEERTGWLKPEYGFSVGRNYIKVTIKSGKLAELILNSENEFLLEGASEKLGFYPSFWLLSLIHSAVPSNGAQINVSNGFPEHFWSLSVGWAARRMFKVLFSSPPVLLSFLLLFLLLQLPCWKLRSRQDFPFSCCCPKSCFIFPAQPQGPSSPPWILFRGFCRYCTSWNSHTCCTCLQCWDFIFGGIFL